LNWRFGVKIFFYLFYGILETIQRRERDEGEGKKRIKGHNLSADSDYNKRP
jgi:hypothetical protein